MALRRKPPLALDLEIETPGGNFTRASDSRKARDRPQAMSFATQRGDGFATGSATLSRELFKDHLDVQLLDTWRMVGRNGEIAYEGRLQSAPRTNDPQEQITANLVGWMTYLKSRKIAPLIIDRRLSGWGEPSTQRKANLLGSPARLSVDSSSGFNDAGANGPALVLSFTRHVTGYADIGEFWLYAGGEEIGALKGDFSSLAGAGKDTEFNDFFLLSTDDITTTLDLSTDFNQESTSGVTLTAAGSGRKYAAFSALYAAAPATGDFVNNVHAMVYPRVIGDHGLTAYGTEPEEGYYISDVLEYLIRTYYPKITWAGQTNTFPLTQATWHDNPSFGYDIFQTLNGLVLWETNVWEDRKLYFEAADLTTYDWQFSTDDPGVTVVFQGDSIENFANGVSVTYTDILSGFKRTIYPDENSELLDENENNPATKHGEALWIDKEVPWSCTEAEAVQFGRAYLAEYNRPKRPGTYTIGGGYIQDGAGHWQQGWKVRNSSTVGIKNHPQDEPRLITATNWDDESATLTITVDAPEMLLDAVVARGEQARQARNLA